MPYWHCSCPRRLLDAPFSQSPETTARAHFCHRDVMMALDLLTQMANAMALELWTTQYPMTEKGSNLRTHPQIANMRLNRTFGTRSNISRKI